MLVLTAGPSCSDSLRLAVDTARCLRDAFVTLRPLAYNDDCSVTLMKCTASGDTVVIKAYDRSRLTDVAKQQVVTEARIHGSLDHPNITPLLLAFEDGQHTYLAVQYASGGDLRKSVSAGRLAEQHVRDWMVVPLLNALAAVHEQHVVHRDLKPENVLLHEGRLMLADFGMSSYSRPPVAGEAASAVPLTAGGTPLYTAPEVMLALFKNKGVAHVVGPKNDIWALGLMAVEALLGAHPFTVGPAAEGNVLFTIAHCTRVDLPAHLSPACAAFLSAALCRDPAQRPSASALLQHAWLTTALDAAGAASKTTSGSASPSSPCGFVAAAVAAAAPPAKAPANWWDAPTTPQQQPYQQSHQQYQTCRAEASWGDKPYQSQQRVVAAVVCQQEDCWED